MSRIAEEFRFLWRTFLRGGRRAFLGVSAVVFAWVLLALVRGELQAASAGQVVALVIVGLAYALYVGALAGVVGGVSWVAWKTVGGWLVIPLVLTPAMLALALWVGAGFLAAQAGDLTTAVVAAGAEHDWLVMALGPASRIGPAIIVIALPLLVGDLGLVLLQPAVLGQLTLLAIDVALVMAAGILPALGVSAVVLAFAYVRRYRERTAARA